MQRKCILYTGFLLVAVLVGLTNCHLSDNGNQRNPTGPQLSAFGQANFWASEGMSADFGVYNGNGFFLIQVPAGEYLLTYTSKAGDFFLVFRAERSAQLFIGLNEGDEVSDATLYTGAIQDTSNPVINGPITRYSELGASGSWQRLFARDSSSGIPIIGGVGVKYIPGQVLELYLSTAGNYVLTYKTTGGIFEYEFAALKKNAVETIALQPGVEVLEAYILKK